MRWLRHAWKLYWKPISSLTADKDDMEAARKLMGHSASDNKEHGLGEKDRDAGKEQPSTDIVRLADVGRNAKG